MNVNSHNEFDVVSIIKKLYKSRKLIFLSTFVFVVLGILIAMISPVKYNSTTVFIPQNKEGSASSLSGVASLVGIDLSAGSIGGEIPSTMYPKVIESKKFKRLLLKKIINEKENLTLESFLVSHFDLNKGIQANEENLSDSELGITYLEKKCFDKLSQIINTSVNLKDGFISINSEMPVAEYSAKVAKFSREILQNIIIENKIESARQNLIFNESQLIEKKQEFDEIYSKLAFFSDSNLNSVNSFVINEREKLQSEFQILSSVVEQISKQVQQAKLQLNQDTPVFSTIQEATIPLERTSPKRKQIIIIYGFIGFVFSCLYVLINKPIRKIFIEIIQN